MTVIARPYLPEDGEAWDALVGRSWNGTFLHTRRFLSYHGDRFQDRSQVLVDGDSRILGIFPAAVDPADAGRIVSHPGITFGGIVHDGELIGEAMIDALKEVCSSLARLGASTLRYKAVPLIYHRNPASDDLYGMFRLNGVRYRCDLSSTIDVFRRPALTGRRRRDLQHARAVGVEIEEGFANLDEFWAIVVANLLERHEASPVHSVDELRLLASWFPDAIRLVTAKWNGSVVAGNLLFCTPFVFHSQYFSANEGGRSSRAFDLLFDHCVEAARAADVRYFDFGTSNTQDGTLLNNGLYQFKAKFGGGGVVHEFYELGLSTSESLL